MNILLIHPRDKEYDSQSVRDYPSGGTEKVNIFLGEAFQKLGHDVEWITTPDELKHYAGDPEVVITQVASLLEGFPDAKKIYWSHHFSDQPVTQAHAAYGRCFADHVVTLSQCHHDDFKQNLRLDSTIIGHGVWLNEIERGTDKDPYRLIYASTPFRGLEKIPALFKEIKAREPRATIAICSSMGTYGQVEKDSEYQALFEELNLIEGVVLFDALNQAELYIQYARASIFCYPCTWTETYCLAMDEAIAHGCVPVTYAIGALPERSGVGKYGGHLNGEIVIPLVDLALMVMHPKGYALHAPKKPQDWLEVAKQWETLF